MIKVNYLSAYYGPDTMLKGFIYFIFFKPLTSEAGPNITVPILLYYCGPYYFVHFIDSENLRETKLSKITCE